MSYKSDRTYGERFIPLAKLIIGPHLLQESTFEIDTKQAADLIVLRAEAITIGMRMRRPKFLSYYDFTLRLKRDSGAKTEFRKVMEGEMKWFFYGWGTHDDEEPRLHRWLLLNMGPFRRDIAMRGLEAADKEGALIRKPNGDGTYLLACKPEWFKRDLIIDASPDFRQRLESLDKYVHRPLPVSNKEFISLPKTETLQQSLLALLDDE